jgi:hypothetical protein
LSEGFSEFGGSFNKEMVGTGAGAAINADGFDVVHISPCGTAAEKRQDLQAGNTR